MSKEIVYYVDRGIDLIKPPKGAKKLVILDHHYNSTIQKPLFFRNAELHLDFSAPTTLDIVLRQYRHYIPKEAIEENKELIEYLKKVETEDFASFNPQELAMYLNYARTLDEIKNMPLEDRIAFLRNKLKNIKGVDHESIEKHAMLFRGSHSTLYENNNTIIMLKKNNYALNYPYFYDNKDAYLITELKNDIVVTYRVNRYKTFYFLIDNFGGGGRKLGDKDRFAGGFRIHKDELDYFIDIITK